MTVGAVAGDWAAAVAAASASEEIRANSVRMCVTMFVTDRVAAIAQLQRRCAIAAVMAFSAPIAAARSDGAMF